MMSKSEPAAVPKSPSRLVRALRRVYLIVGLASLFVAWSLLRQEQGECLSYCTPAFRAGVLVVVGGGCGVLAMPFGSNRGGAALCVAALLTVPWVLLQIH